MTYKGLTQEEVEHRLKLYGYNVLRGRRVSDLQLFLSQFKNPFIYLLILTATLSYILGDTTDTLIIFLILLISGFIGFFQERSANRSVEKLLGRIKTTATVIREGEKKEIPIEEIVVDDVVVLIAGDIVPADILLLETKDFFVDEALLTGEAYPVEKYKDEKVYMGTSVISGYGVGRVEKTGKNTSYGQVIERLKYGREETDFEKGLRNVGFVLFQIASIMIILVFAINAYFHKGVIDSLLYALSVGIGMTPFLLTVIINTTLLHSAKKLATKGIITKRLASLYNLGNMTILCTDKTGTLTQGKMTVLSFLNVMGKEDEKIKLYACLNSLMQTGYKNPIDEAIKSKCNKEYVKNFTKLDEIPFDFHRKRLSILVKGNQGTHILITKGAYKSILEVCSYAFVNDKLLKIEDVIEKIEGVYQEYSEQGYKVIALAYKEIEKESVGYEDEKDMIFGGFIVLHDPLKQDAKESIKELVKLGVGIRIITGDNVLVARKIARELGLPERVISGEELRKYPAEALMAIVKEVYVFAELDPMQKEDIVLALKRLGHVVGYMGDGANDLLAMRVSDVALSVENAMDVVKESADIVFTSPDIINMKEIVVHGRLSFLNSTKYLRIQTSSNFGNMLSVTGASFLIPFIPLLPYQVLTLNLLADISFLTLSSDKVDEGKLKKITSWDIPQLRRFIIFFGPISSIFDYITFFYALHIIKANPDMFRSLWFLESLVTQSLVLLFLRTEKVAFLQSKPSIVLILTVLGVLGLGFFLPYSPLGKFLKLYPLGLHSLAFVLGVAISYIILVEAMKRLYIQKFSK